MYIAWKRDVKGTAWDVHVYTESHKRGTREKENKRGERERKRDEQEKQKPIAASTVNQTLFWEELRVNMSSTIFLFYGSLEYFKSMLYVVSEELIILNSADTCEIETFLDLNSEEIVAALWITFWGNACECVYKKGIS